MPHELSVKIYYEDTDAGGVVYHANYIKFCERARTEYLQDCGFTNQQIALDHNIMFVVRHIEADYFKPAVLEDVLTVKTTIEIMKNTSFVMRQAICKGDQMIFNADVTLVCVDITEVKPVKIPDHIKTTFTNKG